MLRHEHRRNSNTTVSDWELGMAAMLLLVTVVLTVAFLPAFI